MMKLLKYSIALYQTLEEETGQPVDYHSCGSLRLAFFDDRLDEFRHRKGHCRYARRPLRDRFTRKSR